MYSTLAGKGSGNAYMILRVEDVKKAEYAVKNAGFNLADQESISDI